MAKRKTEEPSGAPGRKTTKQEDTSPPPSSKMNDCSEAEAHPPDPQKDTTPGPVRRSPRLNKETENKETKPETEATDESWQEAWKKRVQTILSSGNIVMFLNAERDQDPIGHYERDQRSKVGYGYLYHLGGEIRDIDDKEISELFKHVAWEIEDFGKTYVVDDPDLLDQRLSCEQKDQLIKSLRGYCQQIGWNGLKEQLHPNMRQFLPRIVARTMLAKQIYEMIQDPFFWIGQGDGNVELPALEHLVYPSIAQLRNLYRWFQNVHRWDAYLWRSITVKELVSETPASSEHHELGQALTKLRKAQLDKHVADVLDPSNPLHPFLKPLDEQKWKDYRYLGILSLLTKAKDLSLAMGMRQSKLHYSPFGTLPEYRENFDHMELDGLHHYEKVWNMDRNLTAPERRGVLFMLSPLVTEEVWPDDEPDHPIKKTLWPTAEVIASNGPPEEPMTILWSGRAS